ncbi:MAG: hypothetical protein J5I98_09585 [Phaeodactylibacter sp.]|nr:hypothetical protein [Phaeodactylibacter sp.]
MKAFYSWQSDLDPKLNNYLIRDAIKKAIRMLKQELELDIALDRDTKNSPGSLNIVDEILRKIRSSDIFICDVSLINRSVISRMLNQRLCPNPNVSIELGYAVRSIGWKRIICVFNLASGKVEELPFDVKVNRVTTYYLKNKRDVKAQKESLSNTLYQAMKTIIDNYDVICEEFNAENNLSHEELIFHKIEEILDEVTLLQSFDEINGAQRINAFYQNKWDRLIRFSRIIENKFISNDLNLLFEAYIEALDKLYSCVLGNFYPDEDNLDSEEFYKAMPYLENGEPIPEELQLELDRQTFYKIIHSPNYSDHKEFYEKKSNLIYELYTLTENVKSKWKEFRMEIKAKLKK